MKTTYLVNQEQPDGSVRLAVVSSAQWLSITAANRELPPEQRRHFIVDYIADGTDLDRMVIEAPTEEYRTWHREHAAAQRNRKLGQKYQRLSMDTSAQAESKATLLHDNIAADTQAEAMVCDRLLMEDLQDALRAWKPWPTELLERYLRGEKRSYTAALAEKYGVSPQVIRKYKRQFEEFIKNSLSDVSF